MNQLERLARVEEKVDGIDKKLDQLIDGLDQRYASKLVERIVYGLCGVILVSVVVALVALVVWRPGTTNNLHVSTTTTKSDPSPAAQVPAAQVSSVIVRSMDPSPSTAPTTTPSPQQQSLLGILPPLN